MRDALVRELFPYHLIADVSALLRHDLLPQIHKMSKQRAAMVATHEHDSGCTAARQCNFSQLADASVTMTMKHPRACMQLH